MRVTLQPFAHFNNKELSLRGALFTTKQSPAGNETATPTLRSGQALRSQETATPTLRSGQALRSQQLSKLSRDEAYNQAQFKRHG
jgi:hypothetical protein